MDRLPSRHRRRILLSLCALLIAAGSFPDRAGRAAPRRVSKSVDPWCFKRLRQARIRYRRRGRVKGIRAPVTPLGKIGGVRYQRMHGRMAPLMDCRMLLTMHRVGPILRANRVSTVLYSSFYAYKHVKNTAKLSRHSYGLALDIHGFQIVSGHQAMVQTHWQKRLGRGKTCEGRARSWRAQLLRDIACDLDRSYLFELVLTPDFDKEHHNHFHLSDFLRGNVRRHRPSNRTSLGEYRYRRPIWARRLSPIGIYRRTWIYRVTRRRRDLRRRRRSRKYGRKSF